MLYVAEGEGSDGFCHLLIRAPRREPNPFGNSPESLSPVLLQYLATKGRTQNALCSKLGGKHSNPPELEARIDPSDEASLAAVLGALQLNIAVALAAFALRQRSCHSITGNDLQHPEQPIGLKEMMEE